MTCEEIGETTIGQELTFASNYIGCFFMKKATALIV